MLTIPITLEANRTSPIREARRDLAMMLGDALVLALSIVDDAGAPCDLTGTSLQVQVFSRCRYTPDYGLGWWTGFSQTPLLTVEGVMLDATTGQATAVLQPTAAQPWYGRMGLAVVLADDLGSTVLSRGILAVRGSPVTAALGAPGLVSVGDATLTQHLVTMQTVAGLSLTNAAGAPLETALNSGAL